MPNRNTKPKDAAVATRDPGHDHDELISTFSQLWASKYWEGLLELESEMNAIAPSLENKDSLGAGRIYHHLGDAHRDLGRQGGMLQAIVYFQKLLELAKKAGNESHQCLVASILSECYMKMDRV